MWGFDVTDTKKVEKRDEGNGGADGMVLSMKMLGDGLYSACVFTIIYAQDMSDGALDAPICALDDRGSTEFIPSHFPLVPMTNRLGYKWTRAPLTWYSSFYLTLELIKRVLQWIASTSCSSSACTGSGVSRYNPSVSSTSSGQTFQIPYLSGEVSGPIVWDSVTLGSYSIKNQALGELVVLLIFIFILTS